jgi:hypothetical protein
MSSVVEHMGTTRGTHGNDTRETHVGRENVGRHMWTHLGHTWDTRGTHVEDTRGTHVEDTRGTR